MNGLIEGGAEQVVHSGVYDDETFGGVFFDIKDASDEKTALADERTAKLEVELLPGIEVEMRGERVEVGRKIGYRMAVGALVVDAKSSADVDIGKVGGVEVGLQLVDALAQEAEWFHVGDLRTQMEVQADEMEMVGLAADVDCLGQVGRRETEFVFLCAGGDVAMGVCVDAGIDAEGHSGGVARLAGDLVDDLKLWERLAIETVYVFPQGQGDFIVGFAHPGVDDLTGGNAAEAGLADFVAAHAVGSDAVAGYSLEDAGIWVGFQGVMEMVTMAGGRFGGGQKRGVEKPHVVIVEGSGDALEGCDCSCVHDVFNDWS